MGRSDTARAQVELTTLGLAARAHLGSPPTGFRTVNTGQAALRTTRSAMDPSNKCDTPRRPWVPITIRSKPPSEAKRVISAGGIHARAEW
jgi:hypothetical protein